MMLPHGVRRSPRTSRGCGRCRRQKLKCNSSRPCQTYRPPGCRRSQRLAAAARHNNTKTPRGQRARVPSVTITVPKRSSRGIRYTEIAPQSPSRGDWHLQFLDLPPENVIMPLIGSYFYRMEWFILLFHETSFRQNAYRLICQKSWRRHELGAVMAVLSVAMIGLQLALSDSHWPDHLLLQNHSIDGQKLLEALVKEIRHHLPSLIADHQVESVQVCTLLSSYYSFNLVHDLAWNCSHMAVKSACDIGLRKKAPCNDPITNEVRSRCWNHVVIADTFSSMPYGRPASIEPRYATLHPLTRVDDLAIRRLLELDSCFGDACRDASRATFHSLKYDIYSISRTLFSNFQILQSNTTSSGKRSRYIFNRIQEAERLLKQWEASLPDLFNLSYWMRDGKLQHTTKHLPYLPKSTREQAETILLQAATLRLMYDGILMQAHQFLLGHVDPLSPSQFAIDARSRSWQEATAAALRTSLIPVHLFENHFFAPFASLTQFTAGVVLCIALKSQSFASASQDAKEGVLRIIHANHALNNRIATQTEQSLTDLLEKTPDQKGFHLLNKSTLAAIASAGASQTYHNRCDVPSTHIFPLLNDTFDIFSKCKISSITGLGILLMPLQ
ncbi:hypothetical protein BO71DRAFT_341296 [Aspergillus ellipticus CBS 707.79]|uniref:Xylanolytic transcriptional activator regulatory domain-containing protein n=1 Tax=Aspergillus ellipticus CBS 707.79 TaxID=1448320 RepID=A0A319DQU8_9EURO|nr:hypothetical protein BO71DRAFT_341296 [Aspergillus ellipticus CBS 707.79]